MRKETINILVQSKGRMSSDVEKVFKNLLPSPIADAIAYIKDVLPLADSPESSIRFFLSIILSIIQSTFLEVIFKSFDEIGFCTFLDGVFL